MLPVKVLLALWLSASANLLEPLVDTLAPRLPTSGPGVVNARLAAGRGAGFHRGRFFRDDDIEDVAHVARAAVFEMRAVRLLLEDGAIGGRLHLRRGQGTGRGRLLHDGRGRGSAGGQRQQRNHGDGRGDAHPGHGKLLTVATAWPASGRMW
jgi:hypothetical protein